MVAPFAGAWIEILLHNHLQLYYPVAPFAGAWIEIEASTGSAAGESVAPFAGAWIEIKLSMSKTKIAQSRSLRGSVD